MIRFSKFIHEFGLINLELKNENICPRGVERVNRNHICLKHSDGSYGRLNTRNILKCRKTGKLLKRLISISSITCCNYSIIQYLDSLLRKQSLGKQEIKPEAFS